MGEINNTKTTDTYQRPNLKFTYSCSQWKRIMILRFAGGVGFGGRPLLR